MKKCYNYSGKIGGILVALLFILFLIPDSALSVDKWVNGYVYNSDSSTPNDNDIQITVYLSKNPSDKRTIYNTSFAWVFDVDAAWTWYQAGGGGSTNANIGDEIVIEFLNVSGGTFDGESGMLSALLDINHPQQIGPNDYTLPVEISLFNAQYKSNTVVLNWVTESEVNNLGFNVYRSMDKPGNFNKINNVLVPGAGTTSTRQQYSFVDNNVNPGHTYYYQLESVDIKGKTSTSSAVSISVTATSALPMQHELAQNFPNPFNPETTISYSLTNDTAVQLTIFNMLGDFVTRLVNEQQGAGSFSVTWNGSNDSGQQVSAGMYFYELRTNETVLTRKMIFSK